MRMLPHLTMVNGIWIASDNKYQVAHRNFKMALDKLAFAHYKKLPPSEPFAVHVQPLPPSQFTLPEHVKGLRCNSEVTRIKFISGNWVAMNVKGYVGCGKTPRTAYNDLIQKDKRRSLCGRSEFTIAPRPIINKPVPFKLTGTHIIAISLAFLFGFAAPLILEFIK